MAGEIKREAPSYSTRYNPANGKRSQSPTYIPQDEYEQILERIREELYEVIDISGCFPIAKLPRLRIINADEWFDEYMFRLVVETKYVPAKIMELLKQKPVRLPAWDPMFAND